MTGKTGNGGVGNLQPPGKLGDGYRKKTAGILADKLYDLLFCFGITGIFCQKKITNPGETSIIITFRFFLL